jgi:hypothetical protein
VLLIIIEDTVNAVKAMLETQTADKDAPQYLVLHVAMTPSAEKMKYVG